MLPFLPLLLATAHAEDDGWEMRMEFAAEVDSRPNGVFEVGARKGDVRIELLTAKVATTWEPTFGKGKAWLSAVIEPATHGMWFERWEGGVPRGDLNQLAFYQGANGGVQAWLPHGFYVGAEGQSGYVVFLRPGTDDPAQPNTWWHTADAVFGFWQPWLQFWVRGGVDATVDGFSPHVRGRLETNAPWIARPKLLVHAGWAANANEVVATRLGGNNPYSIPLAGASWAEFWVEDYAAGRGGLEVGRTEQGVHTWSVHALGDAVWFDGRFEWGVSVGGRYENRGRFIEAAWGWAPMLERPGSVPMTGWIRLGLTWGKGFGPREG